MEKRASVARLRTEKLSGKTFYGAAVLFVFLGYLFALRVTGKEGWRDSVESSLRNLLPLALLAIAERAILIAFVMRQRTWVQLPCHVLLAALFSLLWYWLLMVMIGLTTGESLTEFSVRPFFPGPAYAWQLLQGLTFYSLVAAVTYMRAQPDIPTLVVAEAASGAREKEPGLSRYFIRKGEDIHPVDVAQIVSITGADDYAEVVTLSGRHLVRMTLGDFEKALEGGTFVRVHRSRIVNVDRIARAEPAGGGRLLLHMENGEMIQASRMGSKLLRDRVI